MLPEMRTTHNGINVVCHENGDTPLTFDATKIANMYSVFVNSRIVPPKRRKNGSPANTILKVRTA
jgi:hypothetical protein